MLDARSVGKLVLLAAAKQGFTLSDLKETLLLDDREIEELVDELRREGLIEGGQRLALTRKGEAAASEAARRLEEIAVRALARDEEAVKALAPYLALLPYIILRDLDTSEIIVSYFSYRRRAS